MKYREEIHDTKKYKKNYVDGIEKIIINRQREAQKIRQEHVKSIFSDAARYRDELKEMLGWPLVGHTDTSLPNVVTERLSEEETHTVYRMQFEILDGLWMTGLFFEAHGSEKRPLVILQHGGDGTPERISGVYGSTTNYNGMLERVICHGANAFAPQLLLWHAPYEVPFDRKSIDARLKRVGSSITALEVYGITRILDYFEAKDDYPELFVGDEAIDCSGGISCIITHNQKGNELLHKAIKYLYLKEVQPLVVQSSHRNLYTPSKYTKARYFLKILYSVLGYGAIETFYNIRNRMVDFIKKLIHK